MSVLIRCPKCEHGFSIPDKFLGKKGKCPKCSEIFAATQDEVETFPVDDEVEAPAPAVPAPPKKTASPAPPVVPKGKVSDSSVSAPSPVSDSGEVPVFEVVKKGATKIGVPSGLSDSGEVPVFDVVKPGKSGTKVAVPSGKAVSPSSLSDSTPTFPTVSADKPDKPEKAMPPRKNVSTGATTTVIPKGEPLTLVNPLPSLGAAPHGSASPSAAHRPKPPDGVPPFVYAAAVIGVAAIGVAVWFVAFRGKPENKPPAVVVPGQNPVTPGTPGTPAVNPGPGTPRPPAELPPVHSTDQAAIMQMREKFGKSIVQIEVVRGGARHAALGAFVDPRGWIATSYEALMGATQAEIVLADDKRIPVFGYAGAGGLDIKHGLAILKVNGLPEGLTPLVLRSEDPKRGERLFPGTVDAARAALTDTTVLGVLTTKNLPFSVKASVKSDLVDTEDLLWVEHLSALDDRATGGPVLDAEGKIVGVNIVLGGAGQKGYAVHAKHLARAIGAASDDLKLLDSTKVAGGPMPMPPDVPKPMPVPTPGPGPMPEVPVSPADQVQSDSLRLQVLRGTLGAKSWQAATADEYKQLLEVSERLASVAKIAETDGLLESLKNEAAKARDDALDDLANFVWPADVSGTNKQAVEAMNAGEKFMFVFAEVKMVKEKEASLDNRDIVVLQPIGTEKLLFLPIRNGFGDMRVGTQWLIVARREGQTVQLNMNDGKMLPAEKIETRYVIGKPAR